MNKLIYIILFSLLTSCASGTYSSRDGNNSNLNFDTRFCKSLARSMHPGYICRNPLMCAPNEFNIVINELTQYEALFQHCMHRKSDNYN